MSRFLQAARKQQSKFFRILDNEDIIIVLKNIVTRDTLGKITGTIAISYKITGRISSVNQGLVGKDKDILINDIVLKLDINEVEELIGEDITEENFSVTINGIPYTIKHVGKPILNDYVELLVRK